MIVAHDHMLADIGVSGRREQYPYAPCVMKTETTFSAPDLLSSPDPTRCRMTMWVPAWAERAYAPTIGSPMVCEAWAVTSMTAPRGVAYFGGFIDEIRAGRMRAGVDPGVKWFPEPTVTATLTRDPSQTVPVNTSRVGQSTAIRFAFAEDVDITVTWKYRGAVALPGWGLIHGCTSIRNPWDAMLSSAGIEWPVVEVLGVANPTPQPPGKSSPDANNRTFYPLSSSVSTPEVRFRFTAPKGGRRTMRLPDPALIEANTAKRVRGRFYAIDASDFTASAARLRIGDKPFPQESAGTRWDRVAKVMRSLWVPIYDGGYDLDGTYAWITGDSRWSYLVKRLDVDSRSALDVLQRTAAAAHGASVISTAHGVWYQVRPEPYNSVIIPKVGQVSTGANTRAVRIPSSVVEEVPRKLSIASVVNQIEVEYTNGTVDPPVDTVHVTRSPGSQVTPAPYRYATDGVVVKGVNGATPEAPVVAARAPILLRPRPTWTLEEDVTITDTSGVTNLLRVLDPLTRHGMPVRIDGPLPADVGSSWRIRGGSFTIGEDAPLRLTLDPASWLPDLGASFTDMSFGPRTTYVPFSDMKNVTFADMEDADL